MEKRCKEDKKNVEYLSSAKIEEGKKFREMVFLEGIKKKILEIEMWDRWGKKGKKHYRKEECMGTGQNLSSGEGLESRFSCFFPQRPKSSIDN